MMFTTDGIEDVKDLDIAYRLWYRNNEGLRFGQYIFNKYDLEVGNSSCEVDTYTTYRLIYNHLEGEQ